MTRMQAVYVAIMCVLNALGTLLMLQVLGVSEHIDPEVLKKAAMPLFFQLPIVVWTGLFLVVNCWGNKDGKYGREREENP